MDKKRVLILIIIFIVVLFATIGIIKLLKNSKTSQVSGDTISISDEERVLEESRTIIQNTTDFTDRSGFEVVKSDDLSDVKYGTIYSQTINKAQINFTYENKDFTLFVSKMPLYTSVSGDNSKGQLLDGIETTLLIGDDGIMNYYYQKGNIYYQLSTSDSVENSTIARLIKGFDTKIGENN